MRKVSKTATGHHLGRSGCIKNITSCLSRRKEKIPQGKPKVLAGPSEKRGSLEGKSFHKGGGGLEENYEKAWTF